MVIRVPGSGSCSLLLLAAVLAGCQSVPATAPIIVDEDEFTEMPPVVMRSAGNGPKVRVLSPPPDTLFSEGDQITVEVDFQPSEDGASPDMETLEVVVRKGWFGKDITDMVAPYVEDNRLYAPAISMDGHTGEFEFHIAIEDQAGKKGREIFQLTIDD